jgi:hypothetical protein
MHASVRKKMRDTRNLPGHDPHICRAHMIIFHHARIRRLQSPADQCSRLPAALHGEVAFAQLIHESK